MKIIAPAKLNLYLHITGRRDDGYHLLESVFVFTQFGDVITISESDVLSLKIDGPFKSTLLNESIENNLAYRAAQLLQRKYTVSRGAEIQLTKNIPIGAGLGGGSSDAASVLKGLNQFWGLNITEKTLMQLGLSLGADVPACIAAAPALVSGIGENITPVDLSFMPSFVLLVNPYQPLSTQTVFQYYKKNNAAFSPASQKEINLDTVLTNHNDLEAAAITLQPTIQIILDNLKAQAHCALARMSGSGPTCFALFYDIASAKSAEKTIQGLLPNYWVQLTSLQEISC
ncbi:MAG: 4-(cytidine 5'-diphospho)-2-C-methyl-D-erythritol kinase [Gammaproteobacteria bacterium]|nr:4-(cytidine 5'-diphospho)-2-C-methyl-D-erythritol kinase [Gammaproteobacteria bacterium]